MTTVSWRCSKRSSPDLVKGVCFLKRCFIHLLFTLIILSNFFSRPNQRPSRMNWGVLCKGNRRNKNGDCKFGLANYFFSLPMFNPMNPMIWLLTHMDNGWSFFKTYVDISRVRRISGYWGEAWPISGRANWRSWGKTRSFGGSKNHSFLVAGGFEGCWLLLENWKSVTIHDEFFGDLWVSWCFFYFEEEETIACWCISLEKDAATYPILRGDSNCTLLPSILKRSWILTTVNISPAQQATTSPKAALKMICNMEHVHFLEGITCLLSDWTKIDDPKLIQERLAAVEAIGTYAVACGVRHVYCCLLAARTKVCWSMNFWFGVMSMFNWSPLLGSSINNDEESFSIGFVANCWFCDYIRKNDSYIWLPLWLYDYVYWKPWSIYDYFQNPSVVKMLQYLFNVSRHRQIWTQTEIYISSLFLLVVVLLVNCLCFFLHYYLTVAILCRGKLRRQREIKEARKTTPRTKHGWTILILREAQTRILIIRLSYYIHNLEKSMGEHGQTCPFLDSATETLVESRHQPFPDGAHGMGRAFGFRWLSLTVSDSIVQLYRSPCYP